MRNIVISLTKQFIEVPSFVNENSDEQSCATLLENLLKKEIPELQVYRQYIGKSKSRFNLTTKNNKPVLFINGHIDTVQPKDGWTTNPLKPIVRNGKLFGLGASDMKGSLAAFITALISVKKEIDVKKLSLLFYIDEEYDFLGMKQFIKDGFSIKPQLVISLDGKLVVSSGCRGLIEFNCIVRGKSGHSSKPFNGINVITQAVAAVNALEQKLTLYSDTFLGPTTVNLAYMQAGVITKTDKEVLWQREGNIIPDFADLTVEIRPSVKDMDKKLALQLFKKELTNVGLTIETLTIRHAIAPLPVSYKSEEITTIEKIYKKSNIAFSKAERKFSGYIDIQMLAQKMTAPIFIIGAGGENAHGANEYIPLENLKKAEKLYKNMLLTYCRRT